jgi:hypothetical protein
MPGDEHVAGHERADGGDEGEDHAATPGQSRGDKISALGGTLPWFDPRCAHLPRNHAPFRFGWLGQRLIAYLA